jgi:hypothetical protein
MRLDATLITTVLNYKNIDVYEVCTSKTSEASVLSRLIEGMTIHNKSSGQLGEIRQCPSD